MTLTWTTTTQRSSGRGPAVQARPLGACRRPAPSAANAKQGEARVALKPADCARLPGQKGSLYVHCGDGGNCGWNCL
eukprot:122464-Alexandrium_andersonii.AAC.1